ncbi:hypothetical protein K036_3337 [Acinetobacter baumannii 42057_5]|nr:hypothetical protein J497_04101 [Acinetobacter baumannii 1121032]KCZ20586.1 hypothetical protein K036_3337 [Acinetobacter baumannii 42057_5]
MNKKSIGSRHNHSMTGPSCSSIEKTAFTCHINITQSVYE